MGEVRNPKSEGRRKPEGLKGSGRATHMAADTDG
jgi:hypothetical protein